METGDSNMDQEHPPPSSPTSQPASPPTSPVAVHSPATSPLAASTSPTTSPLAVSTSPATSPLAAVSASSTASDDSCQPSPKRRKWSTDEVSRTTLQRRNIVGLHPNAASDVHSLSRERRHDQNADQEDSSAANQQDLLECERSDSDISIASDNSASILSISTESSDENDSSSDNESTGSNNSEMVNSLPSPVDSSRYGSSLSVSDSDQSSEDDGSDSDASQEFLFHGSDIPSNEALLKVLKVYLEERWSKTSLDKNVKLIKRLLPRPSEFPCSGKAALKQLDELTVPYLDYEYTYCCNCLQLVRPDENECGFCKRDGEEVDEEVEEDSTAFGLRKFYIFDIIGQIRYFFEQRDLATLIDDYRENHERKEGYICDIVDGTEYKRIRIHLAGRYDLVLIFNTDGVSISGSSKEELWPILCTICEVSPRLRASFVLVCGVFVGNKKPDMNVFLKPFTDLLKKIHSEGGVSWVHPVSKENQTSLVVAPVLCADAPAKAAVLKHKSHNSRFACNVCEQKTKIIQEPEQENPENDLEENPRKKKKKKRRFLFQEDIAPAPLRTGARMEAQGKLAERRGNSRKGVTGRAIISKIPFLDKALCVCAEYLHLVLLGIVKYLLQLIFFQKGDWNSDNFNLEDINREIDEIKVPDFVKRLPRGIDNFKYWKGSEFRNFLLYYSLPLFKDRLPDRYFQHWLLLVSSMFILLKDAISESELNAADLMLRSFVRDVGRLYGNSCYTYNMHTLLHVCLLVRRWGNLWATSAFLFESFNGFIASHIHGTKNLGREFVNNIKISQQVAVLENIVDSSRFGTIRKPLSITAPLGKPVRDYMLDDTQIAAISQANLGSYLLYARAKVMSEIYTSKMYDKTKKRANSYIQFLSENEALSYGQIIVIVKSEDQSLYCLIEVSRVVQLNLLYHKKSRYILKNLVPVEVSGQLMLVPVNRITTKLLKIGAFFGIRPNSYEINL